MNWNAEEQQNIMEDISGHHKRKVISHLSNSRVITVRCRSESIEVCAAQLERQHSARHSVQISRIRVNESLAVEQRTSMVVTIIKQLFPSDECFVLAWKRFHQHRSLEFHSGATVSSFVGVCFNVYPSFRAAMMRRVCIRWMHIVARRPALQTNTCVDAITCRCPPSMGT
jgi:hypothetical protein